MSKSKNIKKPVVKKVESVIPIAKDKGGTIVKQEVKKQGKNKGIVNLEKGKWKKGKSGNPKGRPLKGYSYILHLLKKQGYEKVTKQEYTDMNAMMLALPRKEMLKLANNEEISMAWRIFAKEMLSDRGPDQVASIADRLFGKPKQAIEHDGDINLTLASGLLALRKNKQRDEI